MTLLTDLATRLAQRPRRVLSLPRRCAVLVPVVDDGQALRLILTRRTEDLPTHKGQVAFPGGGVAPHDADVTAAALREAWEEIGLPPGAVQVLGLLDDFPTITADMVVTQVVARVPVLPPLIPDPREVARVFEIPLHVLRDPARWTTQTVHRWGQDWPMFFLEHERELLWGLSAYITLHLLAELPGGAPVDLPDPRDIPGA